jgi:hypothetical protein
LIKTKFTSTTVPAAELTELTYATDGSGCNNHVIQGICEGEAQLRQFKLVTRLEVLRVTRYLGTENVAVFFLPNNAPKHTAQQTQKLLQNFSWKTFDDPPYSPDLTPSDFHPFPALKDNLSGHRFTRDENVQCATIMRLMQHTIRSSGKDRLTYTVTSA